MLEGGYMNIQPILEYQKLDSDLFKIEKKIRESKSKSTAGEMFENMRQAQERSRKLEEKAGGVLSELEKIKKQYKIQEDKLSELEGKDVELLSKEEMDKVEVVKDKLAQNLAILEKNLASLAENVNGLLAEFNKTIKTFNSCKEKYSQCKTQYDNEVQEVEKDKNEITAKLESLSKEIQPKIMEAYTKRRKENIFPVVVPIKGNCCGGCHMELPYAQISVLEREGVFSCEHCHRLIYKN